MTPRAQRESRDKLAGRLAQWGALVGILVGLLDVAIGSSIRDWVGNKLDTSILGLATVALSLIALAAALSWRRPEGSDGGYRLATVLALAVPAVICFTTIGRLWYLPGVLLLASAVVILMSSTRRELAGAVDKRRWLRALVVVLGGYYVFLGADTLELAGALGILGGLVVWAALAVRSESRWITLSLVTLGALPFAIATWWSVVTPLTALLMLAIGAAATRPSRFVATTLSVGNTRAR